MFYFNRTLRVCKYSFSIILGNLLEGNSAFQVNRQQSSALTNRQITPRTLYDWPFMCTQLRYPILGILIPHRIHICDMKLIVKGQVITWALKQGCNSDFQSGFRVLYFLYTTTLCVSRLMQRLCRLRLKVTDGGRQIRCFIIVSIDE